MELPAVAALPVGRLAVSDGSALDTDPPAAAAEWRGGSADRGVTPRAGPQMLSRILDRPASTIGKVLRRSGGSRLPGPDRIVRQRYDRERPGELVHVDIKKLGRFWHAGKRISRVSPVRGYSS
jgi:hypothetical protein